VKHSVEIIEPGSLSEFIWDEKYRFKSADGTPIDLTVNDTFLRVAHAIADAEDGFAKQEFAHAFHEAMSRFEFLPAGRILAGAGTGRDVTLSNCFVMGDIPDSLDGIMHAVGEGAATMKQGGGIGMNFSTLRPRGATVKGVDSFSSGAVSFMDLWNSMCGTIMSAGSRRGAMMGTLHCSHPDIEEFIAAKQAAGRLTNFNVSVLVTDAFMSAVDYDENWDLVFNGQVYKTVRARDLWKKILRATYDYAEPGVIFIDRVNMKNPLRDIESISCTNPCGELPLPPYGACVLGSINLAMLVDRPFRHDASLDFSRLQGLAALAVRFLDNVITVSKFPLEAQRLEADNKRRIGIGVTGLADALIMLGIPYNNPDAEHLTSQIMRDIEFYSREASIALADEKGPYPLWNESHGPHRRNSHLMSIAPTGTISCFAGNVSSGIEPVFDFEYSRRVLLPDGSYKTVKCQDYAKRVWEASGVDKKPEVWISATDLTPTEHITITAAAQKHIDSAISKTINCDPDISFNDFAEVYNTAFKSGMKGCTTYRPSSVRGAVLIKDEPKPEPEKPEPTQAPSNVVHLSQPLARPDVLRGSTYKIKPAGGHAVYVTINDIEINGQMRPFEIFFATKAVECQAWMTALSRMISAVFRKGGDVSFAIEELTSVYDPQGGHWQNGKYVPSTAAAIGHVINDHLAALGMVDRDEPQEKVPEDAPVVRSDAKVCPKCHHGAMIRRDGCWGCDTCSYSKC